MRIQHLILTILTFCTMGIVHGQNKILFNSDWKFALGEREGAQQSNYDEIEWETVIVPHDASINGLFDHDNSTSGNGWLPFQEGWYRKKFSLSEELKGKKIFIDFDGIYRDSKVWINGEYLGRNLNGYIDFEYDLTPFIKFGQENVITVHYDNRVKETSRWYTGEGIFRDVWLKLVNPVYVTYNGTCITTPIVNNEYAKVNIETEVLNETGNPGEIEIETELIDPKGKTFASKKAVVFLKYFERYTFHQELRVENPQLWDIQTPNLYYAKTIVRFNTEFQDECTTRFGIREIELTPDKGLLLNGKKVFAQGGNIHHDLGCIGAPAIKSGYQFRIQQLKDMGCNSLRLSHNPHSPALLDVCDEMGILVIDEAFDSWTSQYYGGEISFKDAWPVDIERFIKRDRNHPSVYLWSVGNEVPKQRGEFEAKFETINDVADYGVSYLKELVAFTHSVDPSRKVTAALFPSRDGNTRESESWENHEAFMKTLPPPMAFHMDVVSCNYTENFFDLDHEKYPQMMFLASETCTNLKFGNRKISMLEFDKEHVIGHYYWSALSYLGESAWPRKSWQFAFYSIDEQLTPIGYIYKSLYINDPIVKIMVKDIDTVKINIWEKQFPVKWTWYPMLEHWNFKEGSDLEVQTFSNCEEVELFLNNTSLGTKKIEQGEEPILYWNVPYKKGELVAVGRRNNAIIAKDTLITSERAEKIVMSAHRKSLKANGADLVYIQVSLSDRNGNVVPDDKLINFEVTGPATIAGVSNSDIQSDESWQSNKRTTISGKCLIVLRSTYDSGTIEISAFAKGLRSAKLSLSSTNSY